MKRISQFTYHVVSSERIDVQITSISIPLMVAAALDGQSLTLIDQKKFSFVITKGTHYLGLSFNFLPNSPAGASYEVLVTGSSGHESDSFIVERANPHRDLVLVFEVGDTGPK